MKTGIILETKELEKAWNAFRFANTALKAKHEIKVFLMGEVVECEDIPHERFNVKEQLMHFHNAGGTILACGTCLKSRGMNSTEACPFSSMADCLIWWRRCTRLLLFKFCIG